MSFSNLLLVIILPLVIVGSAWTGFKILYERGVFSSDPDQELSLEETSQSYDVASISTEIDTKFIKDSDTCLALDILSYDKYLQKLESIKPFIEESKYKTLYNKITSVKAFCENSSEVINDSALTPKIKNQDNSDFVDMSQLENPDVQGSGLPVVGSVN